MEPNLKNGQKVWVNNWTFLFRDPGVGEIVIFEFQGKPLLKRIKEVKENKIFLIGDNPNDSFDSRKFGFINKKAILGKVIV